MSRRLPALLLPLLLALAACGGGGGGGGDSSSSRASAKSTPAPSPSESIRHIVATAGTNTKQAPKIYAPQGSPPNHLVKRDLVKGHGAPVKPGAKVTVQYTGASWSTGKVFDSSWTRGKPASFPLSGVIPGWQQGIPGMRPGGRRVLIVPSKLGYGSQGTPDGSIAPNETLIFVVDLVRNS
jgi:peptidylprolyl isomerase